jgi:hypothetical protein
VTTEVTVDLSEPEMLDQMEAEGWSVIYGGPWLTRSYRYEAKGTNQVGTTFEVEGMERRETLAKLYAVTRIYADLPRAGA